MERWQARISTFAVVNLVVVPLAGRLTWRAMEGLNADGVVVLAVLLSVVVSAAILFLNIWLVRRAVLAGMPRLGEMLGFAFSGLQFVLTIGFGRFSVVNLVLMLFS